ncbi:MAG TPA: cyclic nucleotide-binding domain-containing protein [Planctomycetota bacterium]|nr:cyclic nucleotide-binding domain-containing protein [Planctomycetota bacterium]
MSPQKIPEASRLGPAFSAVTGRLTAADAQALDAALVDVEVPERGVLTVQGRPGDTMWFIVSGGFVASVDAVERVELGRKGPGDWVGEMSLVSPGPSSATVTATEPSRALALDLATFTRLRRDHPEIAGSLLSAICCDLARRLRRSGQVRVEAREGHIAAIPMLRALHGVERSEVVCEWVPSGSAKHRVRSVDPKSLVATIEKIGAFRTAASDDPAYAEGLHRDVESLAKVMEIETFLDGETVIQGGSRSDGLYLILGGRLRVQTPAQGSDVHVDRVMGPGELVGLVAFFDEGTRAATCTAIGATVLGVIYAASVQEILRQGVRGAPMGVHVLHWFARQLASDARELDARIAAAIRAPGTTR